MGPGDPNINGKITVQVKEKGTKTDVPNGKLELSVKLIASSERFMLNDVMIKNSVNSSGSKQDQGWIYVMDRNIGCKARVTSDNSKPITTEALWSTKYVAGKSDSFKITGLQSISEEWLGYSPLEFPSGSSHSSSPTATHRTKWNNELKNKHNLIGHMYENPEKYNWQVMTEWTLPSLRKNMCVSKGRYFLVADESVCPRNAKGEIIRVVCWLPSAYNGGYGYISKTATNTFGSDIVYLSSARILSYGIWGSEQGYFSWSGRGADFIHFVRLMYMIGNSQSMTNTYSLPQDSVAPQLEYYKNHILQCYGPVKFE